MLPSCVPDLQQGISLKGFLPNITSKVLDNSTSVVRLIEEDPYLKVNQSWTKMLFSLRTGHDVVTAVTQAEPVSVLFRISKSAESKASFASEIEGVARLKNGQAPDLDMKDGQGNTGAARGVSVESC